MPYSKDYQILLKLFIHLAQSQVGREIMPGGEWPNDTQRLYDAERLSKKLFGHLVSMQTCFDGNKGIPAMHSIDHASIKVIARAALETYLVFFYLYGDHDQELSEFRHKTWVLGGLKDRQKYRDRQKYQASTNKYQDVLIKEEELISKLQLKIKASRYIKDLNDKQRKQLLGGNWRIVNSWSDLGAIAGFHSIYFNSIYSYLCGYSHSSYLSVLQVGQAQGVEDQQKLTQSAMEMGIVIMAHFSFSYSGLFQSAGDVLNADDIGKPVAEKWYSMSSDTA